MILFITVSVVRKTTEVSAEVVRKLVHLGGGGVALTLPWLFSDPWPVYVLGALSLALLAIVRIVPALREGPGQVLMAVSRHSFGEFWYVLGVVTLFTITRDVVASCCTGSASTSPRATEESSTVDIF